MSHFAKCHISNVPAKCHCEMSHFYCEMSHFKCANCRCTRYSVDQGTCNRNWFGLLCLLFR